MAADDRCCLVLRLAGPLQSWGSQSQFNRRDTDLEPTKSGIVGLLAAADGRRREDPIVDLVKLRMGIRLDQPGRLLRDYHTASDLDGRPLPSASVNSKGLQSRTTPAKFTAVTQRFYLQDAVFVAAVEGDRQLLEGLAEAVQRPGFPLALGRRACVPSQPILLRSDDESSVLWRGGVMEVLSKVFWQASSWRKRQFRRRLERAEDRHNRDVDEGSVPVVLDRSSVQIPVTVDEELEPDGVAETRNDVPVTFSQKRRGFITRRVVRGLVVAPTGESMPDFEGEHELRPVHDPFALLGR